MYRVGETHTKELIKTKHYRFFQEIDRIMIRRLTFKKPIHNRHKFFYTSNSWLKVTETKIKKEKQRNAQTAAIMF